MASCLGLLHLVDGFGRMLGAAFALAMYGWMRNSSYQGFYWPVVVGLFVYLLLSRAGPLGHLGSPLIPQLYTASAMIVAQTNEITVIRGVRARFLASPQSRGDVLVTSMSAKLLRLNDELYLIIGLAAVVSAGTLAGALLLRRRG